MTEENKPRVRLVGEDGNAYAILGRCNRAARKAGWSKERQDAFVAKATSGDYDNLLRTVMENFEDVGEEREEL